LSPRPTGVRVGDCCAARSALTRPPGTFSDMAAAMAAA
jgi:hypothetical protein